MIARSDPNEQGRGAQTNSWLKESKADLPPFETPFRGYFIIETEKYGYVGMIPVGLDDISSVNFVEKFKSVNKGQPVAVQKGERLGNFAYGGSLVILLFEKGVFSGLNVMQGQQLGSLVEKGDQ